MTNLPVLAIPIMRTLLPDALAGSGSSVNASGSAVAEFASSTLTP